MNSILSEYPQLEAFWASGEAKHEWPGGPQMIRMAGREYDQPVPEGVENPYWEIIRHTPLVRDWRGRLEVYGYSQECMVSRHELVGRYSWSIPSPGDIAWISEQLSGRGLVEVGAGNGYWAWQFAQAHVDVVAYEPAVHADNKFVSTPEPYVPVRVGDASKAADHPDRALFMSWPDYGSPWAAEALTAYRGDLVFYVGEGSGGCCGDDSFFDLLEAEWVEIGDSPHHYAWYGIHCWLTAYRRKSGEA